VHAAIPIMLENLDNWNRTRLCITAINGGYHMVVESSMYQFSWVILCDIGRFWEFFRVFLGELRIKNASIMGAYEVGLSVFARLDSAPLLEDGIELTETSKSGLERDFDDFCIRRDQ